jgi:hypothetical protein
MAGTVACMGDMRNLHKIVVGKPKGKTLLRAPRRRLDNIKMDVKETFYVGM